MFHVSTTAVAIDHAFNRPSINQVIKLPKPPISSSCDSEIDQQQSSSVNLFIIIIIIITLTISHSPSAFTIIRNQPCAVLTSYSNNRQHHETESDVMPRVLEPLCPTAAHKLVFVVVVVVVIVVHLSTMQRPDHSASQSNHTRDWWGIQVP